MDPRQDFYRYAAGGWIRRHPVPADKSRWAGFTELAEQNQLLVRAILEGAAKDRRAPAGSPTRLVGDLFASAMDRRRRDAAKFKPILGDLARIAAVDSSQALVPLLAELHGMGVGGFFDTAVYPDRKQSSVYALYLWQGGLSLPDREYYLTDEFAKVRTAFRAHVTAMFRLLGESTASAAAKAATVLDVETALARPSRTPVALRDPLDNYHRFAPGDLASAHSTLRWLDYLGGRGFPRLDYLVVGQPEFLTAVDRLLGERPLADLRVYLSWQLVHASAPALHHDAEAEDFRFFQKTLLGQKAPEPDWRVASRAIDGAIGEALGQLYVARHFPPAARTRMAALVDDLEAVFRDRLKELAWMTPATRRKALEKFDRFTAKIGHPAKFRDYRRVAIRRDDFLGNLRRAQEFEDRRQVGRVGKPVDRSEWHMTPPTVNAYFDPTQNEIVFPAGILQPPFFDVTMDDAVNYGAIGTVIGHEITHGYDDQGRQFDADGNLAEWWTPADAASFSARAKGIVDQYATYEALPGTRVNGELTQGENIADFGGVSIAFEALQRRLAAHPAERKTIDGFTPEQRFFLAYAQVWRENIREGDLRRRLAVDPHAPGPFRAIGPLVNFPAFHAAFAVREGDAMWRGTGDRNEIW